MTILEDLNLKKYDIPFILIILIFTAIITIRQIYFNDNAGIYCSDVFIYLINSLRCIGIDTGTTDMSLSPVICYATSLLFKAGFIDEISIYTITGVITILGNIGFYILLKKRFTPSLSLLGSILLFSTTLNLLWLATGSIDAPAISFTIWTILFFTLAVDKNPKYYLLALPLFVISFFTRYTAILILPALLIYLLLERNIYTKMDNIIKNKTINLKKIIKNKKTKYFLIGIVLSGILALIFLYYIHFFGVKLNFITTQTAGVNSGFKNVVDSAYTTDTLYYIKYFPSYLFADNILIKFAAHPLITNTSILAYIIILITAIGLIWKAININTKKIKEKYQTKYLNKTLNILFIIITLIIIFNFNNITPSLTVLLTTIDILLFHNILKKYEIKNLNLHLTILAWLLINLLIFSQLDIKVNRYILTIIPAFIYFFLLGLEHIENKIDLTMYKNKIHLKHIITIILLITCIFMAAHYIENVELDEKLQSPELISQYLINYDPNYADKEIAAYNKRPYSWFFEMYIWGINDDNMDYLNENDTIDYYIANHEVNNLTDFHLIKQYGYLHLYARNW